jgi:TolB-like protein
MEIEKEVINIYFFKKERCHMISSRKYILAFMFLILLVFPGCRGSAPVYYINQDIDFSFYKRVAVMPFENLTSEKFAGDIVRQVVISELLASGLVEVVIPGEVMRAVNELDIKNISSLDTEQIKALSRVLNVEAIIMGTVEEYGEAKMGNVSAPRVTITLMMADAGTGSIVWSITKTRGGASFFARHFGARQEMISETVLLLVREAIQTLVMY